MCVMRVLLPRLELLLLLLLLLLMLSSLLLLLLVAFAAGRSVGHVHSVLGRACRLSLSLLLLLLLLMLLLLLLCKDTEHTLVNIRDPSR